MSSCTLFIFSQTAALHNKKQGNQEIRLKENTLLQNSGCETIKSPSILLTTVWISQQCNPMILGSGWWCFLSQASFLEAFLHLLPPLLLSSRLPPLPPHYQWVACNVPGKNWCLVQIRCAVTAHCTLHIAHCKLNTVHWKLHTVCCSLHTVCCSLHTAHYKMHTANCTLNMEYYTRHTAHTAGRPLSRWAANWFIRSPNNLFSSSSLRNSSPPPP